MISPGTNSPRRFVSWFGSLSVAVIVLSLAAPLFSGPTPQLLLPGMFHGGEVAVENGSRWLAIVPQRGHGYAIEEAEVVVEAVYDPIVDADGEMTGLMVTAPACFRTPLFLVRGIESIQTG